eukprot:TRINITY_DN56417_c0_g1_i1.p1 TRINITY_DN56417_c0_g1~~TRINITY_DN56417_c0_g1_i1.p1  ORF type:complete len:343 (-),score=82.47 TRINITY_DN56417_c0_g1_i1:121-1011(-)
MENSLTVSEHAEFATLDAEEALERARTLRTLHLEWLDIGEIENLDLFEEAEVVYLQRNQIRRIEGLEGLPKLQFLALQNNLISKLENLSHLEALEFLDVSSNRIEQLDEEELPTAINILNMVENPCVTRRGYRERLLRRLPGLLRLDGADVMENVGSGNAHASMADALRALGDFQTSKAEDPVVELEGHEQGLSAYWQRDELRSGMLSHAQGSIDAYSVEALADADGLEQCTEGALERSRNRQKKLETADGSSLDKHQRETVKRLSAAIEERKAKLKSVAEEGEAGEGDGDEEGSA